jgi:hypothetical protein
MRALWLLVLLQQLLSSAAWAVSRDDGQLLTSMVASAASADARVDVLTATDLKKAMDVEAGKMALCETTSSSCFAELAAAMDASQVLHGSLGTLGTDVVLNLSLFDSTRATAVGHITLKAHDVSALADRVDGGVSSLLARLPKSTRRVRVLVLDLDVVGAPSTSSTSSSSGSTQAGAPEVGEAGSGPPLLSVVGVGLGVVGLGGLGFAGFQEVQLQATLKELKTANATELAGLQKQRNDEVLRAKIGWVAGGLAVAVGVVLAVVPVVVGE